MWNAGRAQRLINCYSAHLVASALFIGAQRLSEQSSAADILSLYVNVITPRGHIWSYDYAICAICADFCACKINFCTINHCGHLLHTIAFRLVVRQVARLVVRSQKIYQFFSSSVTYPAMGMGPLLLECHGAIDNLTISPRFVWKLLVMGKNGWSEAIYSSCKWFEERRSIYRHRCGTMNVLKNKKRWKNKKTLKNVKKRALNKKNVKNVFTSMIWLITYVCTIAVIHG